jgi:antitoxin CptB
MQFTEADLKRLYWHSRRGMLELDLLLVPFATNCLDKLDAAQLEDYRTLLQEEDQDLWAWLTLREPAPNAVLQRSVELILKHNAELGAAR